jgi:hypothetical protein
MFACVVTLDIVSLGTPMLWKCLSEGAADNSCFYAIFPAKTRNHKTKHFYHHNRFLTFTAFSLSTSTTHNIFRKRLLSRYREPCVVWSMSTIRAAIGAGTGSLTAIRAIAAAWLEKGISHVETTMSGV